MITKQQIQKAASDPEFIKTHELEYAHGTKNHAHRSVPDLIDRLFLENKQFTSSFHREEQYGQCVSCVISRNASRIADWVNSKSDKKLILQDHMPDGCSGTVLHRNENGKLEAMQSHGAKVILTRSIADIGFHIVTAYPSEKERFCGNPQENLSNAMQKTRAYQNADPFMRMYLLSVSDPDMEPIPFPGRDRAVLKDRNAGLAVLLKESGAYLSRMDKDGNPLPGLYRERPDLTWGNLKHRNLKSALKKRAPDLYRQSMSLMEACLPDTYAACMPDPHAADRTVRKDAELKTRVSMEKQGGRQLQEGML